MSLDTPRDRILICRDCQREFVFSAGEILFYESKGLATPKRCPECRHKRKLTIDPGRGLRWSPKFGQVDKREFCP